MLPGGVSGVGSRLRKGRRRKKERDGSALALSKGWSNTPPVLPWLFRESSRSDALAGGLESASLKMLLSNLPVRRVSQSSQS